MTATAPSFPIREFDDLADEFAITRRLLARFPAEHAEWRPHARSTSLAGLATHLAWLPTFVQLIVSASAIDASEVSTPSADARTADALLALHDTRVAEALLGLAATDSTHLDERWTLRHGEHVLRTGRRGRVLRELVVNHAAHHRGQLTVYYRLLGVLVPSVYGPSADEP